ncbi:MAG: hypothetical protein A2946_04210 [Candidatus Liptonbacteria bacterium RIFCSPLOWO2_01_FULL_53_13]|uniref:Uncharacterized protein n=1 Tax=Candidatus Liptonbacteria bacterium RIFCSPLOWO2_01_FULL_53_13 TaxID=1798651 RepID=A0A1G2CMF7_9BACT|nr:MAG: hypothetical protein A2946_04210 [Candidatus Liptonbacteria bacterium RIFCSPLOWO2_01_FULL_53_13]
MVHVHQIPTVTASGSESCGCCGKPLPKGSKVLEVLGIFFCNDSSICQEAARSKSRVPAFVPVGKEPTRAEIGA